MPSTFDLMMQDVGQAPPQPLSVFDQMQADAAAPAVPPPAPHGSGNAAIDTGNAVGTGYFRGMTRLLGLPVDTVANVIDLGKAGIGSAYQAVTGKPAPDALQLTDRKNVVGSGDWLVDKIGGTAPGNALINPSNPDYEGGYSQTLGAALGAVASPNSKAELAKQTAIAITSGLAPKVVKDMGGSDELALTASLLPQGTVHYGSELAKRAIRGGEQGRLDMVKRIQDLEAAGVNNPTLGLASGNATVGGVENLLQNTPGAIGVMRKARDQVLGGLQNKTSEAADLASTNRGSQAAGTAIQKGIQTFRDDFKAGQERLYGNLDNFISPQQPTNVQNTLDTLSLLNADITGAPKTGEFFKNGKIQALESAMRSDTAGAPASVFVHPQPPKAGGGIMNAPVEQPPILLTIPEGPPRNAMPWEAVKKTRTMVGRELADNTPFSDVPRSKWDPLYGALSQDMGNAAFGAGQEATNAFNRATNYTRAGMDRLDRVAPFANAVAPEQAYTALVNASKENVSTLQAVKKTLPQDARGSIAGTVIERLGKATNGVQNESGTVWSPDTFLTNWNKMAPGARDQLFSGFPNAPQVRANVEAVAKAASMMRDNSKIWSNPSGTGANLAARATLGAPFLPLLSGQAPNPYVLGGVAATTGGANLLARMLTSKNVVGSVASPTRLTQNDVNTLVRALSATGNLSK